MLADILKPKICELGKIKIGRLGAERKAQSGNTYRIPEKLDHFIITTMQRDQTGQLVEDADMLAQLSKDGYADADGKIRRLPIRVLSDDLEDVLQASYVRYEGKKCAIRADGKTITWYAKNGAWLKEPLVEPWDEKLIEAKDKNKRPLLKMHAVFNCVIACTETKFGGVYRLRTTSAITAAQLYGSLTHLQALTGGVLVGMPLQLAIRPMQVSPAELNGRSTTVYVLHVEMVGRDLKQLQQEALDQIRFRLQYQRDVGRSLIEYRKLLTAPGLETDEREIAEVVQEFHPEAEPERVETPQETEPLLDMAGPTETPVQESPKVDGQLFDSPDMDSPADASDIAEIDGLLVELQLNEPANKKDLDRVLKACGIKDMAKLTKFQADQLLQRLGKMQAQAQEF